MIPPGCCLLHGACSMLSSQCFPLQFVCCTLSAALFSAACGLLHVVCRLLSPAGVRCQRWIVTHARAHARTHTRARARADRAVWYGMAQAQAPAAATRADEVRSAWCTAFGPCVPPPSAAPPRSERNRVCFAAARCRVHCRRLHVAGNSNISAACPSSAALCLLHVVPCIVSAARCSLLVVCCTLSAACCLLDVARWMVPAAWCLLHVVSCRAPAARRTFACFFTDRR
jgi:hypothetical protein